jgi:hypothetical protein
MTTAYVRVVQRCSALLLVSLLTSIIGCHSSNRSESGTKSEEPVIFTDITEQSKLLFVHDPAVEGNYFYPEVIGAGGAFLDYDNDGDLDVLLINGAHRSLQGSKTPLKDRLFRQDKGIFLDVTEISGLGDTGYGMGAAVGDIDNDGDVDVYITNYGPDKLYRNNGDGTFTDISQQAGISNSSWDTSAVFFDYNRDGFLDIFIANYVVYDPVVICTDKSGRRDYCGPQAYPAEPDVLYRNNKDGTFTDVSAISGIGGVLSRGLGVVSADFNQDHYPDLFVANDQEPNDLWINQHDGTFKNLAMQQGVAVNAMGQPIASMGIALGDPDGDADPDLFITNLRHETNVYFRNSGKLGFQDDTMASGLGADSLPFTGFGTGFFDYDNDGDLDVAVVNGRVTRGQLLTSDHTAKYWDYYAEPNLLYANDSNGRFQNVGDQAGPFCSEIENSRGLVFGDIDNDGDIDLLITNDGEPARLFRNDMKGKGHWLMVQAKDPLLKRDAIGAVITVLAGGKRLTRFVTPLYSYLSSNDLRVHFGLGKAATVEEIMAEWPDGSSETFPGVKADQFLVLEKGKGRKQ